MKEYEMQTILSDFPSIKLSYDKIIHKKVSADLYIAIPYGKKYFAWFTHYKTQNVCFLMEIYNNNNSSNQISKIEIIPACYTNKLAYGTILYGTIIRNREHRFFAIEDVLYFKGIPIHYSNRVDKFEILEKIFANYIKQIAYTNNAIIFGLPVMHTNYDMLLETISNLEYTIYCIKCVTLKNGARSYNYLYKKSDRKQYTTFMVKANVQNDIYELYDINSTDKKTPPILNSIAHIPSYTKSVFMNNLFRTIKENDNLDKLEESDDENEFENIDNNKFVDLNKELKMKCVLNMRFNKWVPIEIATS
jgi:hypothetical protein